MEETEKGWAIARERRKALDAVAVEQEGGTQLCSEPNKGLALHTSHMASLCDLHSSLSALVLTEQNLRPTEVVSLPKVAQ